MKIDTIILSGGSSKGIGYIGAFYAILNNNLFNMKDIKNILGCSVGSIFGFMLLIDFNITMIYKLLQKIDIINFEKFNIDEMFLDNGIFNNNSIKIFLKTCLKYKYNINDITFIELYKKTNINFVVKVYNLSLQKNEHFSHKNHPNLSVIDAIQISSCIPILFKPIKYNNYYYIDGGINNSIPFFKKKIYKNYILIYITSINNNLNNNNLINYENMNYIEYINNIFNITILNYKKKNKRHIRLIIDLELTNFNIKNILDDIIINCYNQTINHIQQYKL